MIFFDIYAHGPKLEFTCIDDLKGNKFVREELFNEDGSIKQIYSAYGTDIFDISFNAFNNTYYSGIFVDSWKLATVVTDTVDEMKTALQMLGIQKIKINY